MTTTEGADPGPKFNSLLLDFPSEIRHCFYSVLFRDTQVFWSLSHSNFSQYGPYYLSVDHFRDGDVPYSQEPGPFAIMHTSKFCRAEALPILKAQALHVFDYTYLLNFPKDHTLFDTASRRHVLIRQDSPSEWSTLPLTASLPLKFPRLASLRVELSYLHAASLRGHITPEDIWTDPKLRQRLLQILEQRDVVKVFKDVDYVIGDELRRTMEENRSWWRPDVFLEGKIGLPRGSGCDAGGEEGGDEARVLRYRINVRTGEKVVLFQNGRCVRFEGSVDAVEDDMERREAVA